MQRCQKLKTFINTGEDFTLYIRRADGDTLIDYTGWSAKFVGRKSINTTSALFEYTEANQVQLGTFDLNGTAQNIRAVIPHAKTLEFRDLNQSSIFIGLYLVPPASSPELSPVHVIRNAEVGITETVAP